MISEGQSFYLNFPTKPTINKRKVQDFKKWALRDFNENDPSSETIHKEPCSKRVKKKLFFAHKSLKRTSISETDFSTLNHQSSPQKGIQATFQKKGIRCQHSRVFSENTSFRRPEKNTIETSASSQSKLQNGRSLQNEKKMLKNAHFNIYDIQTSFESSTVRFEPKQGKKIKHLPILKDSILEEWTQNKNFIRPLNTSKNVADKGYHPCTKFDSNCNLNISKDEDNIERLVFRNSFNRFENNTSFKEVRRAPINMDLQHLLKNNSIESSMGVGSEWVHSLQQFSDDPLEERKKMRNVLAGSYCEQILKFERRELSEKAIFEHKNESKSESLLLLVNSIIHESHGIVAVKCRSHDAQGRELIAFFQKSSFQKQQMKTGKLILLSLPWHSMKMKAFMCPVIICKYFKSAEWDPISERPGQQQSEKHIHSNPSKNDVMCGKQEELFMWKKRLNMSFRIQRIWNHRISPQLLGNQNVYRRSTLLLQGENGDLYLLRTSSCYNPHFSDWLKFVVEGEFYFFENLSVSQRLEQKRFPRLFKYLQSLLKDSKVKQDFIYQLGMDEMTKAPSKKWQVDSPPFFTFVSQPLAAVIKENPGTRVSCFRVTVLLHYSSILYVSDESLSERPYVRVHIPESAESFSHSTLIIKEAFLLEGALHLDEYSQVLCTSSKDLHSKPLHLPLTQHSSVEDIVTVTGNISCIDEKNACIWLQCNFCRNENLVQDTDGVIFCEDCCLVVSEPLLQLKMNVSIVWEETLLNVELLSNTVKGILSLKENSYQPQCNVSDVLGRRIGPLLCYVRGKDHNIFYLREIARD